jgi:hypothetical protein
MGQKPFALDFQPGVQRDGTQLDGQSYLDALWCRFRLGRPRKMGGFQQIVDTIPGVPRKIHCFYQGSTAIVHIGHTQGLMQVVIDLNGNLISHADRTPTSFAGGIDVGWTFDAIFDGTSNVVQLLAHAVPDVEATASDAQRLPFIGQINSTGRLSAFSAPADLFGGNYTPPSVAGGIFCSQPFVWGFDIDGNVIWSAPNQPLTLGVAQGTSGAGTARISAQKIIAGIALRGGGAQSPAALFWSLSEVISAAFIGGTAIWAFNTVSPSSSILSTDCVVEYDGLYFWAGIDRFQVFNGTVSEVPNNQNQDWFFDNMNWDFAAKTFAFKVPRFGEIWFCAPLFGNTEPSHAVIYNVRENCWYDTELPNGGRSAAYFAQGFRYPLMGGSVAGPNGYSLWTHEKGVDQVVGTTHTAVRSYFQTPFFGGPKNTPADDRGIATQQLEPDFIQSGDLTVSVLGQANIRAPQNVGTPVPILAIPNVPQEQFASFTKENHRLTSLVVQSNQTGGSYITGKNILHAEPTEPRLIS